MEALPVGNVVYEGWGGLETRAYAWFTDNGWARHFTLWGIIEDIACLYRSHNDSSTKVP